MRSSLQDLRGGVMDGPDMDAAALIGDSPRPPHLAELFGDRQSGLQPVFVEAGAEMRAAEPGVPLPLQRPQMLLRADGGGVEQGMVVEFARNDRARARRMRRIERDEQ